MEFVLTRGICLGANLGQRHGSLERAGESEGMSTLTLPKLFVVASFSAQGALEVLRGRNMAKQNTKKEGHAKATKPTNVEKTQRFF